ncbi:MAG: glutathionylspermidine synthase family protein [Defluviitaleaceae bacterium]|nr:glutathionylspermidine synthase family protein [Defluviitaleaceae bacterium]
MKDLNMQYADIIRENYEANVASGKAAVDYMENSTAVYKGVSIPGLYMPKLFSQKAFEYLQTAAGTVCGILDKVMQRYLDDPEYRKLFPFDKALEELILIEAHYPRLLPISRLDIFFNEEDFSFKFCEFNADGASAMNEDREINNALKPSLALLKMQEKYNITAFEYFDSWVQEFMDIYNSYDKKVANPRVVIADFMESATPNEFIEFKKAFQKAGVDIDICEIRELTYSNGTLKTPDSRKIDAIYRRAVTRDVMEHKADASAFIQAAKDNAVCIVGHFRTQIIHNKAIFMILRQQETLSFLTEQEREYVLDHIPETLPLVSGGFDLDDVINNKSEWIIKPYDLYASRGVYAGVDMDTAVWEKTVKEAIDTDYLLQRYCPPYKSLNIDFNNTERPEFEWFNNITGMYVYNGKMQGLYSRAGRQGTISSYAEGRTLASMLVREKKKI